MRNDLLEKKSFEIEDNFHKIQNGVNESVSRLDCFIKEVDPHVQYFFSSTTSGHNFFTEVLSASEKDLKAAIHQAIENMNGDVSVHERSRAALKKTMDLNEGVSQIVELLEFIEIFSLNTMVISAKAGTIGEALSTISIEMTRLSRLGNDLSSDITQKMVSLEKSIDGFDSLKEEVEILHEINLTHITLS